MNFSTFVPSAQPVNRSYNARTLAIYSRINIKKAESVVIFQQVVATHKLKASLPGTPKAEVTELKSQVQQLQLQLTNSKHAEAKCKKQLADKTRDMELIERRCSQSENEVKLLRSRVEMLKKETMEALEENDSHTTQVKKLNRELEDKAEQVSELETEIVQLKRKIEQPLIDKDSGDEQ